MILPRPDCQTIKTIIDASQKLKGSLRRAFQVQVVHDYCRGSLSFAKTLFGWHQETVRRGLEEQKLQKPIPDQPGRGRKKISEHLPSLQKDIRELVDPHSQTHPQFQTSFRYTRMTAKSVLELLVREKGYDIKTLPALSTLREMLGKMDYRLRRVQKTKPKKNSRNQRDL
jgi:hypothetical protein